MSKRTAARTCLALLAATFAAATAGCSGGHAQDAAPTLRVTERDFAIRAPKHVRAGRVTLVVANKGPDSHELILVRAPGSRLPIRRDGVTVDEEALDRETAGVLEPAGPGTVRRLNLRLGPGRYELLCNMAGHYFGGMHSVVVVY